MSNRRCNRCLLTDLERLASETDRVLSVRMRPREHFPNGADVYVHPAGIPEGELSDWWSAWFAEIPEHCACSRP